MQDGQKRKGFRSLTNDELEMTAGASVEFLDMKRLEQTHASESQTTNQ